MSRDTYALAAGLKKLLSLGGEVPSSQFTQAQAQALQRYGTQTGAVRKVVKGPGQAFEITLREVVQLTYDQLRPVAPESMPTETPARARNIATKRDSKAGSRRQDVYHLVLKSVGAGVCWRNDSGDVVDLSAQCAVSGLGAIAVTRGDSWHTDAPMWLVENQATFDDLSWLPTGSTGSLIYYGGILDGRLLTWLTERQRHGGLIVFADYDGVGLHQFAKLAATAANKDVDFWLMPEWDELLTRFGSAVVWANTFRHFELAAEMMKGTAARDKVADLMEAMQRRGLALEQEAVWLQSPLGTSGSGEVISLGNASGKFDECSS